MVRVLQIIPRSSDFGSVHQIELLSSGLSPDIQLCYWPVDRAAERYQLLRHRLTGRLAAAALVHAWDWSGLMFAWVATRCRILYTIHALQSASQVRALRRLSRVTARIDFVCSTSIQMQMLQRAGIAPARCHLVEPGAGPISVNQSKRAQLRERLGLDDRDVVAMAPGDSTSTARHRLSLWAISILHVYDRRYRLLISGTGSQASSLRRLACKLKQPALLVSASQRLGRAVNQGELLAAADVALAGESMPGSPLSLAMCVTSGTPIIGDARGLAGQYASEDPSTLLLRSFRPKLVARHIYESFPVGAARADQPGNKQLIAGGRFDPARFRQQMCDLYRSVCDGSCE